MNKIDGEIQKKCPIILSVFRIGNIAPGTKCRFNFSIINLFDEFRQPTVPYFPWDVDYEKVSKMVTCLERDIDNITQEKLRHFGRLIWNHVIPPEIGHYFSVLENEGFYIQLLLVTNDIHIPWEIVYDDVGFWALRYSIGRIFGSSYNNFSQFQLHSKTKKADKPSLLLISDPEGNLLHAKKEGEELKIRLSKKFIISSLTNKINAFDIALAIGSDDYDIIHFAGHAELGERSALKCYRSKLDSSEISGYSLPRHPIVFANACSSAAKSYYGADTKNLAEAFISAGAGAFIGTLWKTNDKLSAEFAAQVYEFLREGLSIGGALMRAKNKLLGKASEHDIDWAAFTLFGNPDSRLFATMPKENVVRHRIQITMSNTPGTLGKILVKISEFGVNIIKGRSITFEDENTAGYIAEIEIPERMSEKEFKDKLIESLAEDLIEEIVFIK